MKLNKVMTTNGWTYSLDYYNNGRRHRIRLNTQNKRLALKIYQNIEERLLNDKYQIMTEYCSQIKLSEYLKDYFMRIKGIKKESTLKGEMIYTKKFIQIVGDVTLDKIDIRTIELWRAARLENIRPVTFNIELRAMKMLFNRALEEGHIDVNPFKLIRQVRVDQQRLYLNEDERKRLFKRLHESAEISDNKLRRRNHYKFMLFCEVLLATGMRRDEAIKLETYQIDYDKNVITVEKTKSKKIREIPMTSRTRQILMELSPVLFKDMTGATVSHKFHKAAVSAGLPANMKLHSLRHTFATMLIENGYDIIVVKELLGHEDIKVTEIYAKVSSKIMRQAVLSLENNGHVLGTK